MLVLSRHRDERIVIDNGRIVITIVDIRGNKVHVGIEADKSIPVHRKEVFDTIQRHGEKPKSPSAGSPDSQMSTTPPATGPAIEPPRPPLADIGFAKPPATPL